MLFASDLDRTLIYSSKFIEEGDQVEIVEYKEGKPISYMTSKAMKKLEEIRNLVEFIPVTTRTQEQYRRIQLFHGDKQPQYAITSNGGTVLLNGEVDQEWSNHIRQEMTKDGYDLPQVYECLKPLLTQPWVEKSRIADDVFFYMLVYKDQVDFDVLKEWADRLNSMEWELIEHGRKIYCIPKCVNKRDALQYVLSKEKAQRLVTSGDSQMDLTMKAISDCFIVPKHGELVFMDCVEESEKVVITEQAGIRAAESVIETAGKILKK